MTARAAAIRQNQALFAMLLENPAFKCPLSGVHLTNPVILKGTGLSYDRTAIENHLEDSLTDPETGRSLNDNERELLPNPAVRDLIRRMMMMQRVQTSALLDSEAAGPVSD